MLTNNATFENDYASYHWERGILIITFKKIKTTLQSSKAMVKDRLQFTEGKKCTIMADIRAITGSTKESLDYFDTAESIKGVAATAILMESFISRFLVNVFFRLNNFKNQVPTKSFNNRQEALTWLEQYNIQLWFKNRQLRKLEDTIKKRN